ncbi:glucose-6-phosphate isomerase [Leucobacter chironomi]|uniref:glucose-6-phosphate isomerase n=1 Tax=Leucobacter chironomi TaxID=491918 RepID=UPI00040F6CC8|nr:glucose-6-phosphate isomerase [Leucobacter chironomi]
MVEIGIAFGDDVAQANGERAGELVDALVRDRAASRLFAHDAGLWGAEAEAEASIRLGWTDFAPAAELLIPGIESLREEFARDGVDRIVLCGMGGSSLAPAVLARWAGVELTMIDSTHPAVLARALSGDLARTAVVVSSKSGSTIETRSHLATFERAFREAGIDPASRVVIVTDPGSPLDEESRAVGRRVFNADPEVGGRFSALTAFGLVPSGLAGVDLRRLVDEAETVRATLARDDAANPAVRLAAAIAAGLPQRFVLVVGEAANARWGLGSWIEQLVAESTGKEGHGVLPIALHPEAPEFREVPPQAVVVNVADGSVQPGSPDRGIVVAAPLGAQLLLWETATALLGRLMGIDPFDQPDVEAAKVAARAALAEADGSAPPAPTAPPTAEILRRLRESVPAGGYLAIQAYVDPQGEIAEALSELRDRLASQLGVPTSLGFGPSYLHSVGQLHKGGPALGAFLQIGDTGAPEVPIPGSEGFGVLIAAQARGDREVLAERGRPVIAVTLAADDRSVIDALLAAL